MKLSTMGLTCLCAVAAIAVSTHTFADTAVQLLQATSDAFTGTLDLQLLVDGDNVATGFQYVSPTSTKTMDLDQLPTGVVLLNQDGYDVITVKSPDFDPAHGGAIDITYLNNAMSSTYDTLTVNLVRNGNDWQLMYTDQSGTRVVTQGYFQANRFFGQVIGIDQITLH